MCIRDRHIGSSEQDNRFFTMRQILLILPTDSLKGGAETVLHLIAKELVADSDTQITVAFLTGRVYHGWDRLGELPNVSLIFTQSQSVWCGMPKLILNLIRLRGRKFDICFTSHTDMTGVAGLLKRLRVLSIQTLVARESCSVFLRYKRPPLRFRIHHTLGYPCLLYTSSIRCGHSTLRQAIDGSRGACHQWRWFLQSRLYLYR